MTSIQPEFGQTDHLAHVLARFNESADRMKQSLI